MKGYEDSTYGQRIAEVYDSWYGIPAEQVTSSAVQTLSELAGEGPVMELGIGTGRLALPLAERGLEVHGNDVASEMVAMLRQKPGGDTIPVVMGSMADVELGGPFSMVFVAFNTFFGLRTQKEQVAGFKNVARHLTPGGRFVIDAFVPDLSRFVRGQNSSVIDVTSNSARIDLTTYDPVEQVVSTQHVIFEEGKVNMYPVSLRFAFPSELDLMAQLAGMELESRYGGWDKRSFAADSPTHVSVYRKS